jgi:hypothetical protein
MFVAQMYAAIEASIPIIAVAVYGKGYDFATASALLLNLETALEDVNPGACDLLKTAGVDPLDVAYKLSAILPNIISVPLNSSASSNHIEASLRDIVDAITGVMPFPIPNTREQWLKTRPVLERNTAAPQHGDNSVTVKAPLTAVTKVDELAPIPLAVPYLPEIMSARDDVVSTLRQHLIGSETSSLVAISSATQQAAGKKVSTHGQGGVGKTTLAILMAKDLQIRRAFGRVGWVSVGQTPDIPELQRTLYGQLTGGTMEVKGDATIESQLRDLQAACRERKLFVVIDDVWEEVSPPSDALHKLLVFSSPNFHCPQAHEKALNCIDDATPSRILVTSRIRGLVQDCAEVSLDLLTADEATDLLLRGGGIDSTTAADRDAAVVVAELCGKLPLYVGIIAGIVRLYEGDASWQEEVVAMLKTDRMGLINEESDSTVERVVESSLKMLSDENAKQIFMSLGLAPEDVPVPLAAVQLLCKADPYNTSPNSPLKIRTGIKKLLDRNLLQGSISAGVTQHDIVRDFVRSKFGGEDEIRKKQRAVVFTVVAANPEGGFQPDNPLGKYVKLSLRQHMVEAVLPDKLADEEAHKWLDASENITEDYIVVTAANALEYGTLLSLAEHHESAGDLWLAAKRVISAALTDELNEFGQATEVAGKDGAVTSSSLLKRAANLLHSEGLEETVATRTLEIIVRGMVAIRLSWDDDWNAASLKRINMITAKEVALTSPSLLLGAGCAQVGSFVVIVAGSALILRACLHTSVAGAGRKFGQRVQCFDCSNSHHRPGGAAARFPPIRQRGMYCTLQIQYCFHKMLTLLAM